jgi:hypothetical protein
MAMTPEQIKTAAEAAIRAMTPEARATFIQMFEAGNHNATQDIAQAYAFEGVSRQISLAHIVLEDSRKMDHLTAIVAA